MKLSKTLFNQIEPYKNPVKPIHNQEKTQFNTGKLGKNLVKPI